jgi:CRP/FNR family transcriptional regulator, nitrogen oxide reductase regulator
MPEGQRWVPSAVGYVGHSHDSVKIATKGPAAPGLRNSLFCNLSPTERSAIVAAARKELYLRRQTIYREGEPARQVVLLTSGCAKIVQCGQDGNQVILRLIGPGEALGTVGLNTQERYRSAAQVLCSTTALVWDAATFESLSSRFPALKQNIADILCKRLEELEERFREISTEKVATRLGHELVRLLNQVGRRVKGSIQINLSREELAQLIGTTLFSVSRLLSDWHQQGIVVARRESVAVPDLGALIELIDRE